MPIVSQLINFTTVDTTIPAILNDSKVATHSSINTVTTPSQIFLNSSRTSSSNTTSIPSTKTSASTSTIKSTAKVTASKKILKLPSSTMQPSQKSSTTSSYIKSNTTRKHFLKQETIGIDSHQINNFKNYSRGFDDNKTSRKYTGGDARYNRERGHLSSVSYQESISKPSTSITLTIYSDEEETPKVSYIKPELKDKNKNLKEERKDKVTYNIKIEQHSSSHEVNSGSQSNDRTNSQKDVELSLTPAIVDPTTTPMELLEVETSFKFTEKSFPVDSLGELLFIF